MTTATRSDLSAPDAGGFDELEARITGAVITPSHPAYDEARKVQHLGFDRYPAAVVRPADGTDVATAVTFARENGYQLAVRSGGHALAGFGTADGALVIDLSRMNAVSIDPLAKTARVQPGANSGQLCAAAHAYGLALTTGDTSSVGIGGLALGGGIGWMVRKYGLTIDNLISIELVTARGDRIRASKTENAELFWGLRGGGGNFGIVTEFEFRMAPVGSVVGGIMLFPATPEAIRGYIDYTPTAPEGLTTIAQIMHAPPAPFVPEEMLGRLVFAVMVCFAGDPQEAEAAIEPLRPLGEVLIEQVGPMPYPAMFELTREAAQPALNSVRGFFADDLSDDAIKGAIESVGQATSPMSMIQLRGLGGAYARVAPGETAFAHRERKLIGAAIAIWLDPSEAGDAHRRWTEEAWRKLQPDANGAYSNFLADDGAKRIKDAYPEETYQRLAALKRQYDPENFFSLNQNIRPS